MILIGIHPYPVTIASGQSLSPGIAMGVDTLVGIWMPAAWTAAGLSFQVSPDDGATWLNLSDPAGAEVALTAAASVFIQTNQYNWRGINMIKVRSGTSGTPVAQGADRLVTLIGRPEVA